MVLRPAIHYTWNVSKCFEFAKSWLEHYHVPKKDIDRVFAGTSSFIKKYSKKPPAKMLSKNVEEIANADAKELRDKIEKKLRELDPPLTEKRIQKVLHELPDGEDLTDLLLSYRIFNTEERIRVRKPLSSVVELSDINIKYNNNKAANSKTSI
ncbi:hypothetical protein PBCVCVR1_252L [Paramecium bursaria Chlorella virus CVR-1]|uniref:Uncharacterized protein n=1 Tax=Paramecium bursaria Chlorella virus CVA-1 TaxID=42683 RepID=M1HJS4_9PHYC|nr:hypothetical protein F8205_gp084 [Paramecium bursaria Chlorella virus CVA-1]AGE50439.1 hypothetical protein PBCVCVA1_245L [Paramecium bursaria Chlorella virus CVA-1]AGE52118.1 hypothetical protein PBCVCVR1_252L [Paramecium bursaria Chlorella virus CVR-1]